MKTQNIFLCSMSIVIVLLLVSCRSEAEIDAAIVPKITVTQTSMSQLSLEPTGTIAQPTATVTIKPTPVSLPTATVTMATEIITPTITAVILTPLPTFAAIALETAVDDLLADPMNCDTPCWWGAIPGKTTFFEIQQFIELYQFSDYVRYMEQVPDNSFELGMRHKSSKYGFRVRYGFDEKAVLTSLESGHAPPVSDVLKKYGQPDDVWLTTGITPDPMYIRFNLVYLQESMAFGYRVVNVSETSKSIKGCFANETGSVILKSPHSITVYTDFFTLFELERRYILLEEATDLTMEEFMDLFSDPSQSQCIETPVILWE